jgi:hypothetical protein
MKLTSDSITRHSIISDRISSVLQAATTTRRLISTVAVNPSRAVTSKHFFNCSTDVAD